jgi:hypothetical protein
MTSDVIATLHNGDGDRCVKIVKRADGTFGLREFRKDPEDAGGWTLVSDSPTANHATKEQALDAARAGVAWLGEIASPWDPPPLTPPRKGGGGPVSAAGKG